MAAEAIGKSQKTKNRVATVLMVIFFTILAILIILPIYAIILASFKPGNHLLQYGLNLDLDSASMTLSNYVLLFTGQHDYWIWFRNSLFLTVVTVVLTLLVSAFVAYGFAAYDFKGKNFFFVLVLIILSIPFEVIMLPLYKQMSTWGLMDSYVAVVLPFLAHASTIFFFRQYLLGTPKSLIEAGRIDGATEYGIFFRLIVPILKPAFSAMAILNGMNAWNNYLWPLIVNKKPEYRTVMVYLANMVGGYNTKWNVVIASAMLACLPVFLISLLLQSHLQNSIKMSGIK